MPSSQLINAPLMAAKIGLTMKNMIRPMRAKPMTGYSRIVFRPSRLCGKPAKRRLRPTTNQPATNPATKPPRKPAALSVLTMLAVAKVAIQPPTNPGINAGRSPMDMAMYAANTGTKKLKA